jgi:YesN/AraC family two-component response regulator
LRVFLLYRPLEGLVIHKVLIVDDSKLARMAVVKALTTLHPDWSRVEASNAAEAVEKINQGGVDIILLDFNMPGKDGLALASELRETHPDINVAVISANHQVEVIKRARDAGATFLPKPLTAKALGEFLDIAVKRIQGAG